MDPPIKLFGQTIAFTTSASSQDDALDGAGTTSSGAWEELSSSPQDALESGAESRAESELTLSECPASCFPELSSSVSHGAEDEKICSPPCETYGFVPPVESSRGRGAEDGEDLDVEDTGFGQERGTSQEVCEDDVGGKGSKMPRRPDKAVACPRCRSLETKFCYYNNYNVNQPRHFCKHCQRYWTAGGTLRNVPVGAGRRKNKHGSVPPRQTADVGLVRCDEPDIAAPLLAGKCASLPIQMQVPVAKTVMGASRVCSSTPLIRLPIGGGSSDGGVSLPYTMRVPSVEATYIVASPGVNPSDTGVLGSKRARLVTPGFGDHSDTTEMDGACCRRSKDESTRTAFSRPSGSTFFHEVKGESGSSPAERHDNGDVSAAWNSGGPGEVGSAHSATSPFGFFNGGWPYGYNVGWSGGAAFCAGGVGVGNSLPPPTPASVAAWSGAATGRMWTGMPWPMPSLAWSPAGWGPPPWPISPWAIGAAGSGAAVAMSPSIHTGAAPGSSTAVACPGGTASSSLGKRARLGESGTVEGAVWAPKSLRMADPEEAMRSSVWRILGVGSRPDLTTANTFKAFQSKSESTKFPDDEQQAVQATLQANPAAMSRSMYFQESN